MSQPPYASFYMSQYDTAHPLPSASHLCPSSSSYPALSSQQLAWMPPSTSATGMAQQPPLPTPPPVTPSLNKFNRGPLGSKLDDVQQLKLLDICVSYRRVFLDPKPEKAFWATVKRDFLAATSNNHSTLQDVVKRLVVKRRAHLAERGTGTEPDNGELNQRLDKWIEIVEEKDTARQASKKSAEELQQDADRSRIDRDNMKLSLSRKRDRNSVAEGDASDSDTDALHDEDPEFLASDSPFTNSSPTLQRGSVQSHAKRVKRASGRSALRNEIENDMEPFVSGFKDALNSIVTLRASRSVEDSRLAALEETQKEMKKSQEEMRALQQQILEVIQRNVRGM